MMMEYRIGDRLTLSSEWIRTGGYVPRSFHARVVGQARDPRCVRILIAGYARPQTWLKEAWVKARNHATRGGGAAMSEAGGRP